MRHLLARGAPCPVADLSELPHAVCASVGAADVILGAWRDDARARELDSEIFDCICAAFRLCERPDVLRALARLAHAYVSNYPYPDGNVGEEKKDSLQAYVRRALNRALIHYAATADICLLSTALGLGADMDVVFGRTEITPLINAAKNGRDRNVSYLLGAGADPTWRDMEGKTARDHLMAGGSRCRWTAESLEFAEYEHKRLSGSGFGFGGRNKGVWRGQGLPW